MKFRGRVASKDCIVLDVEGLVYLWFRDVEMVGGGGGSFGACLY